MRQVYFPGHKTVLPAACTSQQSYPGSRSAGHYNHEIVDAGFHSQYGCAPVAPGRSIAGIVEVAALDQKLKRLGHDAAKELDERLIAVMRDGEATRE